MATVTQPFAGDPAALELFHPAVRTWFASVFEGPTRAQSQAWPAIAGGKNTLLLAPTGSGKTLAAFLVAIDRLMFQASADRPPGVQTLYISPLKALGVDVERNLRSPLAGVRVVAERDGHAFFPVDVAVRSGDTDPTDRRRLLRQPPQILITTPESLYLMLTSQARNMLSGVETVIVDEIHSLVSGKRGAHLFLSLERLENLRRAADEHAAPLQRIGLSATQRPLEEVARLLGGAASISDDGTVQSRAVEIVDASYGKTLEIQVEVPVEDMARLAESLPVGDDDEATVPSIWPAVHPRLVELIREHTSTIIFVNSRRLAERLATALNETAGEEIALAHHGSIAKHTRRHIEDRLKQGQLPALVATSSLELGIDMGAVDLVVQIEAPPSIASGIQRIGRAGHHVGSPSTGIIIPKYRGDLLACSAAVARMHRGEVEPSRYPRNPLDVLAQQIVAMVAMESMRVEDVLETVRRAAPFHELPRSSFEGVLDLLSGRYPSSDFAELRPRIHWDRAAGTLTARAGAQRVALLNAGTIPDRGLYGVFLSDDSGTRTRVGELDEEMVFESRPGDVFLLGASSWRIAEITHDRVLVTPAPGQPGRMPFWKGDGPGRPLEFGRAIGELARKLTRVGRDAAQSSLIEEHGLEQKAAGNLLNYLHDQSQATQEVPSDRTIVIESFQDEVGDWRVVILSPFGSRVHAPWATAVAGTLRAQHAGEVDVVWADDGIMFRLPESDAPPAVELLLPKADEIEEQVVQQLAATSLFAARFRENAARALLLPRRRAGGRSPLWLQRRRAADLLAVASQFAGFPIMLETYRECLQDVFDLPGLKRLLRDIESRTIFVRQVQSRRPSPFATSLLFSYTASFLYDGDVPLAERRAQALALDHSQLRELLGEAELRELLDAEVLEQLHQELQRLDRKRAPRHADDVQELLRQLGDLSHEELIERVDPQAAQSGQLQQWLDQLLSARRIVALRIQGQPRYVVVEDAVRYRDALGVVLPPGLPQAFLESVADPLADLISRYARTHGPFTLESVAQRFGLGIAAVREVLRRLTTTGRIVEGEFTPGGRGLEWCDNEILRRCKRRSLARLRKQIEPVEPETLARFVTHWQNVTRPRKGLDALLDAIEQLQAAPLPASVLESDILPQRITDYEPGMLDQLCLAGEVVWRGIDSLGESDGRIALYLTDQFPNLAPPPQVVDGEAASLLCQLLAERGALRFDELVAAARGFQHDVLRTLWDLVWAGLVTNDTLAPLRSLARQAKAGHGRSTFRSRRQRQLPGSEGRWSLLQRTDAAWPSPTERQTALAQQLLARYGLVTREMVAGENIAGGFAGLYPIFKALEETGRVRRGYFVAGLGGAQFALPGADERLRQSATGDLEEAELLLLAATDPANPYGAALAWPQRTDNLRPQRGSGCRVMLHNGRLLGFLSRTGDSLLTYLPTESSDYVELRDALIRGLKHLVADRAPLLLAQIDGQNPAATAWGEWLVSRGFVATSRGYLLRSRG